MMILKNGHLEEAPFILKLSTWFAILVLKILKLYDMTERGAWVLFLGMPLRAACWSVVQSQQSGKEKKKQQRIFQG
jgi:hypothetical protein